jgi:vacuolar-type H+-ATPase subunit H
VINHKQQQVIAEAEEHAVAATQESIASSKTQLTETTKVYEQAKQQRDQVSMGIQPHHSSRLHNLHPISF